MKRRRQGRGAWRWHNASSASDDQWIVQGDTQPRQRVADGRRCHVKTARGLRHASLGKHGFEHHEQVQIELR
jgi:hypothetical protein